MGTLQELVIRLAEISPGDLNSAIFEHPEVSVLDAVELYLGPERSAGLREAVAEELGIRVWFGEKLQYDDTVLRKPSLQLAQLVETFQVYPLKIESLQDGDLLELAVSDPSLGGKYLVEFSKLLGCKVEQILAPQSVIQQAIPGLISKLVLSASEAKNGADDSGVHSNKLLEDPEIRKALQQLVASAVKHQAQNIQLDLNQTNVKAEFLFGDGVQSTVEMKVSPISLFASMLRRGQVVNELESGISGISRIRFKSVVVNYEFRLIRKSDNTNPFESTLILERFVLDNPDNPAFWYGLSNYGRTGLRKLLELPQGLLVVFEARDSAREFALRSIGDSYPDAFICELNSFAEITPQLLRSASDQRVVVGLGYSDFFSALESLRRMDEHFWEVVNGVAAFHQLARNCPTCAVEGKSALGPDEASLLKASLQPGHFKRGEGCFLCRERGALGFYSATEIVGLRGLVGELLRSDSPMEELAAALKEEGYKTLLEDGLESAALGVVPLPLVLAECPKPPREYLGLCRAQAVSEKVSTASAPRIIKARTDSLGLFPVRGKDAFLLRPESSAEGASPVGEEKLEVEDDWLTGLSLREVDDSAVTPRESSKKKILTEKRETKDKVDSAVDKPTLLVIDDDPDQRAILRRVFELAGYQVEVAADGIDGIVSAVRLVPSLIIVDFMMPELDGRETIRRLKQGEQTNEIPIVALTAYADPDVELGLLQAGADDFCPKSVSKQVLLKRIERLIG